MMSLKVFDIDIVQLPSVLAYKLGPTFFELFEYSLLERGELAVTVKADSKRDHIRLLFHITGTIELLCDRSLEAFDYPVHIENEVNFMLGNENQELSTTLYMIEQKTTTLNIAQHIYDFVSLEVPMKKLHPRFLSDEV